MAHDGGRVAVGQRVRALDVALRDDEHVYRRLRVHVVEDEHVVVLVYLFGRDLAARDPAKEAVVHVRSPFVAGFAPRRRRGRGTPCTGSIPSFAAAAKPPPRRPIEKRPAAAGRAGRRAPDAGTKKRPPQKKLASAAAPRYTYQGRPFCAGTPPQREAFRFILAQRKGANGMDHTKFVFVTGGVVSSLGKGITAASLGRAAQGARLPGRHLQARPVSQRRSRHDEPLPARRGVRHRRRRGDDLDIGHYERFIDETLSRASNATSGQVYLSVIERERAGGYSGGTVQIVPHITDEIKLRVRGLAEALRPDVLIVEIGGTVGDIESLPFLEAARQLRAEAGAGRLRVCARHARAVHRRRGRAQEQAHAALGQGAARHRHPAGCARLPLGAAAAAPRCGRRSPGFATSRRRM